MGIPGCRPHPECGVLVLRKLSSNYKGEYHEPHGRSTWSVVWLAEYICSCTITGPGSQMGRHDGRPDQQHLPAGMDVTGTVHWDSSWTRRSKRGSAYLPGGYCGCYQRVGSGLRDSKVVFRIKLFLPGTGIIKCRSYYPRGSPCRTGRPGNAGGYQIRFTNVRYFSGIYDNLKERCDYVNRHG